jgi:hypothetical protein
MFRKKISVLMILVGLCAIAFGVISAQGPPGGGYWFGATHQNVGSSDATISIEAYDSNSSSTYAYSPALLAPGASINVGPNDIPGLPAGFIGSIVTSADQPLVALVNITNRLAGGFGVADGKAAAIYSGVESASTSNNVSFPLVKYNAYGKTTTFYLQNAGSSAATFDVVFKIGTTDYPYTSPSVAPGQSVAIDAGLAGVSPGNSSIGSMSASSAQPIAGVMMEHEHSARVGTVLQGSSGFAPNELEQVVYCPTYKESFFGRKSGIQVQNAHSTAQDITATFVTSTGATYVSTINGLAAGASKTIIDDPNVPANTLSSVKLEGSLGDIAAIVNESELPLTNPRQTSTTYNCVGAGKATTNLAYPAYKEGFFGRTSALQVQNVSGSTATNVVLTFTDDKGNVRTTKPQTIESGASGLYLCVSSNSAVWSGASLATDSLSGVTVSSDQPIIAVVNEASWTSTNPCSANNGATSFDKSTSNTFNLQ